MSDYILTPEQKRVVLELARNSIRIYFQQHRVIVPPADEFLQVPAAAFVTLRIQHDLRGCIGSIEASRSLGDTIVHNALAAAFQDPRFPPLNPEELNQTLIEVSVLSPFRTITSIEEVQIGRDGIYLTLGPYRGLLLPQVAVEQNWDAETFISHTCRKAGLPPNAWQNADANIQIFAAEIFGEDENDHDVAPAPRARHEPR